MDFSPYYHLFYITIISQVFYNVNNSILLKILIFYDVLIFKYILLTFSILSDIIGSKERRDFTMFSINYTPSGDKEKDIEMLKILKKAAFTHVGIEFNKSQWLSDADYEKKANELKDAINDTGLSVSSAHLFHYPLDVGVSVKYEETEELIKRSQKAASIIEAPFWVAHPRSSIDQNFSYDVAAKHNKEDFLPVLEYAKENGAVLLFENMPVFPDFPGHRYFSSKPLEFAEFIDSFESDSVGVCWDIGHAHMLLDEDEFGYMKTVGKRIKLIEVNNNWIRYDSHMLPSCGSIDWNAFAKAVKEMDFTGGFVIDSKPAKVPEIAEAYYNHAFDCLKVIKERIDNV